MSSVRDFFQKKTAGYYIYLLSCIFAIAAAITYEMRGGDALTKIDHSVTVLLFVGIIINVLMMLKDIKPLEIIPFVLYLIALVAFIATEIDFIGNVFYGVDGNAFDPAFFGIIVLGILAVISGMIACMMKIERE